MTLFRTGLTTGPARSMSWRTPWSTGLRCSPSVPPDWWTWQQICSWSPPPVFGANIFFSVSGVMCAGEHVIDIASGHLYFHFSFQAGSILPLMQTCREESCLSATWRINYNLVRINFTPEKNRVICLQISMENIEWKVRTGLPSFHTVLALTGITESESESS